MIILQKYIADSGFLSRRKAEELIKVGRVKVNGGIAKPGMKVGMEDVVEINGKKIGLPKDKIYIKLYKPAGYVSTAAKYKNEKNIFELVKVKERLFSIGRLDKASRGLMILTNDGDLAQKLSHPKFEHEKEYKVEIKNKILNIKKIEADFGKGLDIGEGDEIVKAKEIEYLGGNKFRIILTEGKKRQIRRMFKALGLEVKDLKRTRIAKLELGNLKEGEWKYLDDKEKNELKKSGA